MQTTETAPVSASPAPRTWRSRLRRARGSFWFNLLAACLVTILLQNFIAKVYYVPSGSMENTLLVGDRILVNRLDYVFNEPQVGDVAVFAASDAWEEAATAPMNPLEYAVRWVGGFVAVGPSLESLLVKRIVAGPGQTLSCCDSEGRMLLDGVPLEEDYIFGDLDFEAGRSDCTTEPVSRRCFGEITVPAGKYLVMGDHRSNSSDSVIFCRGVLDGAGCARFVDRDELVGPALATILPIGHWRSL